MTAPGPRVAVLLLNWRAPRMTLDAVGRVFEQTVAPAHVFVVENGSGDNSADFLADGLRPFGDRVTLLINDRNLGFGGGCNTALRHVLAREFAWVWLLNNDAEPEPVCLAELLAAAAAPEGPAGLVGTLMVDPAAPSNAHYGSWMNPLTLIARDIRKPEDFDRHIFSWMTAASLLVSTDALGAAGLFDERFFMYWEDADLNMRIRKAGFSIVAAPAARAVHRAGTSSMGMEVRRYLWHLASQQLFLRKHHPAPHAAMAWLRVKYLLKAGLDRDTQRAKALLRASSAAIDP